MRPSSGAGPRVVRAAGRDDAYITYWAADALARTGEIVNCNGARVEQSSSLFHVVLLAVVSKLSGTSVPGTGWLVGVAGGLAVAILAVLIADRLEPGAGWRAGLFVATSAYVVYWSFGGLETSIAAAMFLLALWGVDRLIRADGRPLTVTALFLAPYLLSRPEAPLVLGSVAAGALVCALIGKRWPALSVGLKINGAVRALVATIGTSVGVVAFRVLYFGDIVPQPARAKFGGVRVAGGYDYLSQWLYKPGALALVVAAGVAAIHRRGRPLEALLWMAAGAQLSFVVATGGTGWRRVASWSRFSRWRRFSLQSV